MNKKEKENIEYCFKYYTCKRCPRNRQCEEEARKYERTNDNNVKNLQTTRARR